MDGEQVMPGRTRRLADHADPLAHLAATRHLTQSSSSQPSPDTQQDQARHFNTKSRLFREHAQHLEDREHPGFFKLPVTLDGYERSPARQIAEELG